MANRDRLERLDSEKKASSAMIDLMLQKATRKMLSLACYYGKACLLLVYAGEELILIVYLG